MFRRGERAKVDGIPQRLCSWVGREKGWTTYPRDCVQVWGERNGGRHTLETVFMGGEREMVDDIH